MRPEIAGALTRSQGDFDEILASSDLIVEVMGGTDPAREYILRALQAGKHVVTANKQVLSQHGEEIYAAARDRGAQLRFEASVGGVVPVIRVINETLAAAHIHRVHGIVNGTTNFILSEMTRTGETYESALAQAQQLGYAEADPSEDVNGKDAAAKMAIIARLAFNAPIRLDQVPHQGIENITPDDIAHAKEFGLSLKLVGTAERVNGGISVRVYPAFLYGEHPLASVDGAFNAVTIESPAITEVTLSRPGVLAQVAELLGLQGVSVKSVVQHGLGDNARLVMVMHPVLESKFLAAVELIGRLDFMRAEPRIIRVI